MKWVSIKNTGYLEKIFRRRGFVYNFVGCFVGFYGWMYIQVFLFWSLCYDSAEECCFAMLCSADLLLAAAPATAATEERERERGGQQLV